MQLSIVTFNIKGTPSFSKSTIKRLTEVGKFLNNENPDIVNLQEVFTYKHLEVLKNKLANYPYCLYKRALIGPKGGLVTFSKLKPIESRYIAYSYPLSLIVNLFSKGWIRVIFRNLLSGKGSLFSKFLSGKIIVVNTHMVANPTHNWSSTNKFNRIYSASIERLKDNIKGLDKYKKYKLIILTGDFNIPKNSVFYRNLIQSLGVKDVYEDFDLPTFKKVFLPKGEKGKRLDYILLKSSVKDLTIEKRGHLFEKPLIEKKVNKGFLSDHIALKVAVKF